MEDAVPALFQGVQGFLMPGSCLEGIEGDDTILPHGRLVAPGLLSCPSWSSTPADWYCLLSVH